MERLMPEKFDPKVIIITILTGACMFLAGFGVSQMTLNSRVTAADVRITSCESAQTRFSERLDKLIEQNTQIVVLNNTLLNQLTQVAR
jgi:hypoxanthine-guanine phosphoribosyltransferase